MKKFVMTVITLGLGAHLAAATTRYVDRAGLHVPPFTTPLNAATNIQAAVDAAGNGDIVLIAPGRYIADTNSVNVTDPHDGTYDEYNFYGNHVVYIADKRVTLRGASGNPADVIIDGEGANRGIGAWIPFGSASPAAVPMVFDSLTVSNCHTVNINGTASYGGGISLAAREDIFFYVTNCVVTHNITESDGSGIYHFNRMGSRDSILIVSDSIIKNNQGGNALHSKRTAAGGYLEVHRSRIENNTGGGIYARNYVRAYDTRVTGNSGRGVMMTGSSPHEFHNCTIINNGEEGIYLSNNGILNIFNTLIADNSGYGVFVSWGSGTANIYNSTIVGNNHGIYTRTSTDQANVFNSIVYDNYSGAGTLYNWSGSATPVFSYSCTSPIDAFPDPGNIDVAPDFVDAAGGNYRLRPGSPCIGQGEYFAWMTDALDPRSRDCDGNARLSGGAVDMGCYEYPFYIANDPLSVSNTLWLGRAVTNPVDIANLGMPLDAELDLWTTAPWLVPEPDAITLAKDTTNQIDLVTTAQSVGAHADALRIVLTNASLSNRVNYAGHFNLTNTLPAALDVLDFNCVPGGITNTIVQGATAPARSFDIVKTGVSFFDYTITTNDGMAWLEVDQGAGTLSGESADTITVSYDTASLTPGTHSAVLRVASTNWGGKTQDVAVVMNVNPVRTDPLTVTNVALQGINALPKPLHVYNVGTGVYNYTLTPTVSWLNVLPSAAAVGAATNAHTVHYITAGLAPGEHSAGIRLVSHDHGGLTQEVAVALTVLSQPELAVTPLYLEQTIGKGDNPGDMTLNVWNAGFDPRVRMGYTVTSDAAWIESFNPGHVTDATNALAVRFKDMTGLASGTYRGHLTVVGRDAGSGYLPVGSIVMTSKVEVVINVLLEAPAWISASSGTELDRVTVEWGAIEAHGVVNYEVWRGITWDFDERWTERLAGALDMTTYHDYRAAPGQLHY